jgi:hypothetical protein
MPSPICKKTLPNPYYSQDMFHGGTAGCKPVAKASRFDSYILHQFLANSWSRLSLVCGELACRIPPSGKLGGTTLG